MFYIIDKNGILIFFELSAQLSAPVLRHDNSGLGSKRHLCVTVLDPQTFGKWSPIFYWNRNVFLLLE